MTVRNLLVGAAIVASGACVGMADAAVTQLFDRNSAVSIEDSGALAGMNVWNVDNIGQLSLQGFWYRIQGDNSEHNVGTLPITGSLASDTNPFVDPRNDTLALQYSAANVRIEPSWRLQGGLPGSGRADMIETIVITNTGAQQLNISFFQYSDFDLAGTVQDQSVQIAGGPHNTAQQSDINGFTLNETVVTPPPTHYQVATFPTILGMLNDGVVDNLNDTAGPIGPGDLTWAFQWDFSIAPGASITISKDKSIVPTPGSFALLGLAGLAGLRRRR